jgi:hypothetical protein
MHCSMLLSELATRYWPKVLEFCMSNNPYNEPQDPKGCASGKLLWRMDLASNPSNDLSHVMAHPVTNVDILQ